MIHGGSLEVQNLCLPALLEGILMIHFFPEKPIHNLEQIIVDQSGKTLYGEIAIYNMTWIQLVSATQKILQKG